MPGLANWLSSRALAPEWWGNRSARPTQNAPPELQSYSLGLVPSWIKARETLARLRQMSLQPGQRADRRITRSGIVQPIRLSEANIATVARRKVQHCGG